MRDYQRDFLDFAISRGVLRFGEFTLKSGRISPYFFNAGLFNSGARSGPSRPLYAAALMDPPAWSSMCCSGRPTRGSPFASATAVPWHEQHDRGRALVLQPQGGQGSRRGRTDLVGAAAQGSRMLMVDDVITAGTAIRETLPILAGQGAAPAGVVIALDRQERGRGELSAVQEVERTHGIRVLPLVTLHDLISQQGDDFRARKALAPG
jgi:orotate phosphoribosyltransferase